MVALMGAKHKDMINVLFRRASLALEAVALEIANHGWKHNLRIGLDYFFFVHFPVSQWMAIFCRNQWLYTHCRSWNAFPLLKSEREQSFADELHL